MLVLNLLLHVLVSLQKLVVLNLSQSKSLIQVGFKVLLKSRHLVLLLLDELVLSSDDLLLSFLHVLLSLVSLHFVALVLDLMGRSIVFLLGKLSLDLLLVQKVS